MNLRKENVLIVDDDYDMLELLYRNLKAQNYHTYKASSVTEAIEILKSAEIDLLITDLQMPGINGIELIRYAREHYPQIPKLVITGYPTVASAVDSVRSGAVDYLVKPFTSDELKKAVSNAFEGNPRKGETKAKTDQKEPAKTYAGMIGNSPEFSQLIDVIDRVKDNRATILIQGESGTGKELVARAIHYKGVFAANPFIAVNCGALPENLLESELFGYTKGAFTGANETRSGLFQAADSGTIFLDEIGNAPLSVQTRLLRVLQEKEVSMIGSHNVVKINVRIIAATNADLEELVRKGEFREDLYYRLNVVSIVTPPLRERPQDIMHITLHMLRKYGTEYNKPDITLSDQAALRLKKHSWPGNIRELENVIQRMIIMSGNTIEANDVPEYMKYPAPRKAGGLEPLRDVERAHIRKVLEAVGNNKTRAAEILQIDRKTLRQKL